MGKTFYVCEYCGSIDIENRVWANMNTKEVTNDVDEGEDECFCNNCGESTNYIEIDESELVNLVVFNGGLND
jgi:hypothetical protein